MNHEQQDLEKNKENLLEKNHRILEWTNWRKYWRLFSQKRLKMRANKAHSQLTNRSHIITQTITLVWKTAKVKKFTSILKLRCILKTPRRTRFCPYLHPEVTSTINYTIWNHKPSTLTYCYANYKCMMKMKYILLLLLLLSNAIIIYL